MTNNQSAAPKVFVFEFIGVESFDCALGELVRCQRNSPAYPGYLAVTPEAGNESTARIGFWDFALDAHS